ncbi:uncharacterized protein BDZ99DRAFT_468346 [Mytilinidion resinicola]|uniref:Uncharacterized protein n=1 Tax=Mytilinidion resinicola TaxID=574789 RepID=A0A6A6Y4E6_9PEZI|nr:uncharacterized protein BDZ99DRAFT_468346 [Mytilinidion resinicola]KAF2803393.1 hypothetical protein BDZ99DRAFT_468346 [Mytilinidion resinicola]
MEGDGFYRPDFFNARKLDRFPISPLEWVHFFKRLNLQLLVKINTRALFALYPLRVRISPEEQATDRVIRFAYDTERVYLQGVEWDGQQSLLDFMFDKVVAAVPPPHRSAHKFDREMRKIFESIRLSMFFEYVDTGITHAQIFSGPIPEDALHNFSRLLIF